VGVSDLNKKGKAKENFFSAPIKRFIRHAKSYKGTGKYGRYGGYDISLIQLEKPVSAKYGAPACLPNPTTKEEIL
jgi:hypothetical protein